MALKLPSLNEYVKAAVVALVVLLGIGFIPDPVFGLSGLLRQALAGGALAWVGGLLAGLVKL